MRPVCLLMGSLVVGSSMDSSFQGWALAASFPRGSGVSPPPRRGLDIYFERSVGRLCRERAAARMQKEMIDYDVHPHSILETVVRSFVYP